MTISNSTPLSPIVQAIVCFLLNSVYLRVTAEHQRRRAPGLAEIADLDTVVAVFTIFCPPLREVLDLLLCPAFPSQLRRPLRPSWDATLTNPQFDENLSPPYCTLRNILFSQSATVLIPASPIL